MPRAGVVVVGSVNVDLVVSVGRLPAAGETVVGAELRRSGGGKGANQAVAAARGGARTALIAAVGADQDGAAQLRELADLGVDVSAVRRSPDHATGTAIVLVAADGENSIVVASGANAGLHASDVANNERLLSSATVVVGQTEVPARVIDAAAAVCRRAGNQFVLNCAPIVSLEPATFATADPLVVNEVEAAQLLGHKAPAQSRAIALRDQLAARSVIVTRGSHGAMVAGPSGAFAVPAAQVRAVDTTGAGDAFVGALAAALSEMTSLHIAAQRAVAAATQTVIHPGARSSW